MIKNVNKCLPIYFSPSSYKACNTQKEDIKWVVIQNEIY